MPNLVWAAFILAGGKSSRYGSDKSQALFEGRTLLEQSIAIVRRLSVEPRLVGWDPNAKPEMGLEVIPDEVPYRGPVEGMAAAATVAKARWGLFLPLDMPKISPKHLTLLLKQPEHHGSRGAFAFQAASGFKYKLPCLVDLGLLRAIQPRPASLGGLLMMMRAHWVTLENHGFSVPDFLNINEPGDLA